MTKYDPSLIQTFSDRLYAQATYLLVRYIVGFTLFAGLVGGGVVMLVVPSGLREFAPLLVVSGMVLGGLLGASAAQTKAFKLKLEAQLALCQLQVEVNTRPNDQAASAVDAAA